MWEASVSSSVIWDTVTMEYQTQDVLEMKEAIERACPRMLGDWRLPGRDADTSLTLWLISPPPSKRAVTRFVRAYIKNKGWRVRSTKFVANRLEIAMYPGRGPRSPRKRMQAYRAQDSPQTPEP